MLRAEPMNPQRFRESAFVCRPVLKEIARPGVLIAIEPEARSASSAFSPYTFETKPALNTRTTAILNGSVWTGNNYDTNSSLTWIFGSNRDINLR